MTIIVSNNGQNAQKVEKSSIDNEDYLQRYIYENPDSIPVYEIKENARLLILAREFPTESGPIDALAVDSDGELYIVETKLYNNADKRRVVAQVIDYGAALWKHTENFDKFVQTLDRHTEKQFGQSARETIIEFFGIEEEQAANVLESISTNLSAGNIKFVILMDQLDERLKDLILYVNQNSKFDIYAVEFTFYKHQNQEIIIPRLFGGEVKKSLASPTSSKRRIWTVGELLADAEAKLSAIEFKAFLKLYRFCENHADQINLGTGSDSSFSPIFETLCSRSLLTIYTTHSLTCNFNWVRKLNPQTANRLYEKMHGIGFPFPQNYLEKRPGIPMDQWVPKVDQIIGALSEMIVEGTGSS